MKTLKQIIKSKPVYLNDWKGKIDVIGDFDDMTESIKKWENINILFASYSRANYSGNAWVLFEQDGKLYEVNGSHCSCYGLEGQWEPEEVSLKELEHRLLEGTWGEDNYSENNFKQELCTFLDVEFKNNSKYGW